MTSCARRLGRPGRSLVVFHNSRATLQQFLVSSYSIRTRIAHLHQVVLPNQKQKGRNWCGMRVTIQRSQVQSGERCRHRYFLGDDSDHDAEHGGTAGGSALSCSADVAGGDALEPGIVGLRDFVDSGCCYKANLKISFSAAGVPWCWIGPQAAGRQLAQCWRRIPSFAGPAQGAAEAHIAAGCAGKNRRGRKFHQLQHHGTAFNERTRAAAPDQPSV